MDTVLAAEQQLRARRSDEQLVELVRAGHQHVFETLIRRHTERLRRVVKRVLKDDAQVDDVLQESFLRAFSHLDEWTGAARFATWLIRIAVNEAVWRKRRAVEQVDLEGHEPSSRERGPEEQAEGKELAAAIERAVDTLPESYRDVFMLRMVDGFSVAETAWVLGATEEAVRMRAFRANEQLRAYLGK